MKIPYVPDEFKTALLLASNWKKLMPECRFHALKGNVLYLSCPSEYRTILEHQTLEVLSKVNIFLGWRCVESIHWVLDDVQ